MDGPWIALLIATPVILMVAATVWLVRRLLRARDAADARMALLCRGHTPVLTEPMAQFFGLQALGPTQMRGNGRLALVDDTVVFVQLVPHRVVRIRIDEIIEIGDAKGFLGKTQFQPLLKITWRPRHSSTIADEVGRGDGLSEHVAAWRIRDLATWQAALRRGQPAAVGPR